MKKRYTQPTIQTVELPVSGVLNIAMSGGNDPYNVRGLTTPEDEPTDDNTLKEEEEFL
ncbi:MAG: hypothetical protein IKN75_05440 [Prevotella sp.]|nr:hypothetical protein [Prevotella sp.]